MRVNNLPWCGFANYFYTINCCGLYENFFRELEANLDYFCAYILCVLSCMHRSAAWVFIFKLCSNLVLLLHPVFFFCSTKSNIRYKHTECIKYFLDTSQSLMIIFMRVAHWLALIAASSIFPLEIYKIFWSTATRQMCNVYINSSAFWFSNKKISHDYLKQNYWCLTI